MGQMKELPPHKKATKPDDIEEERRMFYVAVTRAKSNLHIYYVRERYNKSVTPSRFVNEIRLNTKSLKVGEVIRHRTYGRGVITFVNQEKISIRFEDTGLTKTFHVNYLFEHGLLSS